MKEIPLTKGYVALIDDEDYDRIAAMAWHVLIMPDGRKYAAHNACRPRRCIYMHREIVGALPGQHVDHEDGYGLNNQKYNLRACKPSQNRMNSCKPRRAGATSIYKGVARRSNGINWQAQIKHDYKYLHLGSFIMESDAAEAYDRAAFAIYGKFARLNFPDVLHDDIPSHSAPAGANQNVVKRQSKRSQIPADAARRSGRRHWGANGR